MTIQSRTLPESPNDEARAAMASHHFLNDGVTPGMAAAFPKASAVSLRAAGGTFMARISDDAGATFQTRRSASAPRNPLAKGREKNLSTGAGSSAPIGTSRCGKPSSQTVKASFETE